MQKRVLLVEDNEGTIDVMGKQLKYLGYEVSVARNGLEALAMATESAADLIVMDMHMPKMDGFEAVRRIKANPATQKIPVLAATAKALESDKEKCLAAGCDGYIPKPFTHRDLGDAIDEILKRVQP